MALITPMAFGSRTSGRWWTAAVITNSVFEYGVENIQVFRGLDPRFSKIGSPTDQTLGGIFFVSALILMLLTMALLGRFFWRRTDGRDGATVLALRYGSIATLGAFVVGIIMSLADSPASGANGSLLPLHAAGFHALQAVPLIAIVATWAACPNAVARRAVHYGGMLWLAGCLGIAWQSLSGYPILELAVGSIVAAACFIGWAGIAVSVGRRRPPAST